MPSIAGNRNAFYRSDSNVKMLPRLTVVCLLAVAGCQQPGPEVNFVGGLGAMDLGDEGGFDSVIDGPRLGGQFSLGLDGPLADVDGNGSGPRVGGRLGFSGTYRDLGDRDVAGEPLLQIEDYVGLSVISPQVTAAYRQYLGGNAYDGGAFYVQPGVGAGLGIGILNFGSRLEFGDNTLATDSGDSETDVAFAVQPFLRLGYDTGATVVGFEAGYLWSGVDFDDDLGRDASQAYGGLFVGIRLGR